VKPLGELEVPQRALRYAVRRLSRPVQPGAGIVTAFNDGEVTLRENRRTEGYHESADRSGYIGVRAGDLVVHGLDLVHGSVGVSDSDGQITPVCWVLEPREDVDATYLAYALRVIAKRGYVRANAKGVRSAGADYRRWETLAEVPVPVPPLSEQRRIAAFLERESRQIKELRSHLAAAHVRAAALAASRRSELLDNAWQAFPRRRVGWDFALLGGFAFQSQRFVHDPAEGVALLRGTNVSAGRLRWDDTVYWPHDLVHDVVSFALREGDLVVGLNRPWIAGGLRIAEVQPDDLPALLLQRVACIRSRPGAQLTKEYLRLLMESSRFKQDVGDASAVTFPMLEPKRLASWRVPTPSVDEQRRLVEADRETTSQVQTLRQRIDEMDARLSEYQDLLTTDAITGRLGDAVDRVGGQTRTLHTIEAEVA
jgi:type I restriction enzyme S subunit